MNGEGEASSTTTLDNHLHFQETYTLRYDIPSMLPQQQRAMTSTIPEEEEEEEEYTMNDNNDIDNSNNSNNNNNNVDMGEDYDEDDDNNNEDNLVDIANRTFMLTCKKFSRQSYPEFRRRQAYSFLETWYLHSMYSKSQQILLGISQATPVVLLSGDDLMFTPQLIQQQHFDRMQQQQMEYWHEDDDYYDDDMDDLDEDEDDVEGGEIGDDDPVLLVQTTLSSGTTTTSRMMMDENMWMGSSRHYQTPQEQEDSVENSFVSHENEQLNEHHVTVQQEQPEQQHEQQEQPVNKYTALSPEVVHWYRSAQFYQRRPSTIMEVEEEDEEHQMKAEKKKENTEIEKDEEKWITAATTTTTTTITATTTTSPSTEEYQSLVDIIPPLLPYQPRAQQPQAVVDTIITVPAIEEDNEELTRTIYGTTVTRRTLGKTRLEKEDRMGIRNYFDTYHVSTRIVDTAWLVLETADTLTQEKQNIPIRHFTRYMFNIWRLFFLCVESILSDVGGLFSNHSKSSASPPSKVSSSTSSTSFVV